MFSAVCRLFRMFHIRNTCFVRILFRWEKNTGMLTDLRTLFALAEIHHGELVPLDVRPGDAGEEFAYGRGDPAAVPMAIRSGLCW